jgi:inhibitor of KinA sporulation pathway (predicted exonuclease)
MLTDELKGLSFQQDMHKYINDARCTHDIKCTIATGKSSIEQEGSCHQQLEHKFNKKKLISATFGA